MKNETIGDEAARGFFSQENVEAILALFSDESGEFVHRRPGEIHAAFAAWCSRHCYPTPSIYHLGRILSRSGHVVRDHDMKGTFYVMRPSRLSEMKAARDSGG